jgi:hypothetical protein
MLPVGSRDSRSPVAAATWRRPLAPHARTGGRRPLPIWPPPATRRHPRERAHPVLNHFRWIKNGRAVERMKCRR